MSSGVDALRESDFSVKYVETGSSEMDQVVGVFNAMIDKLREEKTHQQEQSFFIKELIKESPLGIIILDYDDNISDINQAAATLLAVPIGIRGMPITSVSHPLLKEILMLEWSKIKVISLNGIDKYKCQVNEVIHQGFKRKFIIIDDLSSELLASEKEAYGRIIRMMAHEVNNSIGAINSILNSVISFGLQHEEDKDFKESLEIARDRNDQLNKFMANYASILRLPPPRMQRMDLCALLKKTGLLFSPIAAEKDISISFEFEKPECPITGDAVLLEQAISNIIKNAIESITQDGDIIIKCTAFPRTFSIIDNGKGIAPEDSTQLFTPFYSTKPTGQGVGLMLVKDILMKHNATFSLKTDPDTGLTSFSAAF